MRKIVLTIPLIAFLVNGYSQTCDQPAPPEDVQKMSGLLGTWSGEFEDAGKKYQVAIVFYKEGEQLKAQITNDAHWTKSYLANVSLCSTNKFHFFGSKVDGESFRYNARLSNDVLTGNYKRGQTCSTENQGLFKLQKAKL